MGSGLANPAWHRNAGRRYHEEWSRTRRTTVWTKKHVIRYSGRRGAFRAGRFYHKQPTDRDPNTQRSD